MISPFRAVLRNEFRLLRRDTAVVILTLAMPLIVISILKSTVGASLVASGAEGATGAEQAVPGIALLFGFFICGFLGLSVFREHSWGTWDRMRATRADTGAILAGKATPWAVVSLVQMTLLFVIGVLIFDLNIPGLAEVGGIALIIATWSFFIVAFALFVVAIASSVQVVQAFANLGAMVFGTLGGALVALAQLPGWARAVSPLFPTHWAMRGFRALLLEDKGFGGAIVPALVLVGFAVLFGGLAAVRFDGAQAKVGIA